ncbi:MAG: hypothetical protein CMM08_01560 [Rhodospirillaceae bacterium]|nr:hypothetical protein [Rhodospirillaceae bacterium]
MTDTPPPAGIPINPLTALFEPRSVAVIGASQNLHSIGGRPIRYMRDAGFAGIIYPVSPRYDEVAGYPCYASLAEIPGPVDLAIIAVAAKRAPEVLEACIAKGVPTVVVYSSGFAETGPEGAAAQARLAAQAKAGGVRLVGPNSMGCMNLHNGFLATFSTVFERDHVAGPLALVTQSGAYGSYILAQGRELGLGLGLLASTGNEADLELGELIGFAAGNRETRAVLAYVEGLRDGEAFLASAQKALEAACPLLAVKVGRSESGARAALSHTGSLAGTDAAYQAVFRQMGVVAAPTVDAMLDTARLVQSGFLPAGRRIGLLTMSGGGGVLMADDCESYGLEVPELPAAVQVRMKEVIPFAGVSNPVDFTAQVLNEPERYGEFLDLMLEHGDFDAFIVFFAHMIGYAHEFGITMAEKTVSAARQSGKPFVMVALTAGSAAGEILDAAGIPTFQDPSRAVAAVAALAHYAERRPKLLTRFEETAALDRSPIAPEPVATEFESKAFLARHGLAITREAAAGSADEATARAAEIGFPVALKVLSAEIQHKTEIGGIKLGLADVEAVRAAYDAIEAATGVSDVLVQEMASGLELILGLKRDPVFGPMVLCGLGGIHAEVMRDVALRHAPVDHATAAEMLQDLAGYALLEGSRGAEPCDIQAVIETIVRLSHLGTRAAWIEELDVNPLMVGPRGGGCLVADALIVRERTPDVSDPGSAENL